MRPDRRTTPRLAPIAAALALIAALAAPARAQDDEEDEVAAAAKNPRGVVNAFAFDDANFDAWVYNGRVVGNSREWFEARLSLRLDELDRSCGLTEAQKAKLRLAGKGDAKRFFDIYDEKRRKFMILKHDQNKINEIFVEIRPLQLMIANGAFGRGSLFDKTVKATLTPEQAAKYEVGSRERRASRFRARIDLVVAMLDGSLGLSADQRRRLLDVLAAEAKVPPNSGQYEYYLVMYQASQMPEERLKPIFDEAQWKLMSRMLSQAKGYQSFLRTSGLLEDPPAAKAAAK